MAVLLDSFLPQLLKSTLSSITKLEAISNIESDKQEKGKVHGKCSNSGHMRMLPVIPNWKIWMMKSITYNTDLEREGLLDFRHY